MDYTILEISCQIPFPEGESLLPLNSYFISQSNFDSVTITIYFIFNFLITEYYNQKCHKYLLRNISVSFSRIFESENIQIKDFRTLYYTIYIYIPKISDTDEHSIHDHIMSEKILCHEMVQFIFS